MNAHRLLSIFSRQSFAPLTILVLFSVVVICGLTAGAMQSSAETSVGNGRGNQRGHELANRPVEDIKKDFNADDLKVKEKEPRGKWGYGIGPDTNQFDDASVPVAVGAIQSLSGGGKYAGVVKIKRLEIRNRSPKAVNSVQLRWKITSLDDPSKVLLEGNAPFVNFWAEANSSQVVEIPTIYPSLLFKPLAKDNELNGRFKLTIGVQEAYFADGTFWRRQEPVVLFNFLYDYQAVANQFPSLASISPIFPLCGQTPVAIWLSSSRAKQSRGRPPRLFLLCRFKK